jgi:hypothetical protein
VAETMEYFSGVQWWYLVIPAIALLVILIGKIGKVSRQYEVELVATDPRFQSCISEIRLSFFEKNREARLEIDLRDLQVPVGESLAILHHGTLLANIPVAFEGEAEYEQWGNADTPLPDIRPGDELVIAYQGKAVLKGKFIQTI